MEKRRIKMIKSLTEKQTNAMPEYANRYIKLGLSTSPLTPEVKELLINEIFPGIYADAGLEAPKKVLFFDSPLAMLEAAAKDRGTLPKDEMSNLCYGSQDAGWISFYKFFQEECGVDLKSNFNISRLCGLCSFWLPYDTAIYVSQNLSAIHMDNGLLHNLSGPSWSYADGTCGYSLYGIPVTEEIVTSMLPDKENGGKRIMQITNTEQRLVAIRAYGVENMLEQLSAKVIDTKKGTIKDGDSRAEYVLYRIKIEGNDEKLLEMANPSEPKRHYEWVDPNCNSVNQALAWRCGWDEFTEPVAKT
jgi:hypothetical protein